MYLIILCYYDIIDRNINNNLEGIKYTQKKTLNILGYYVKKSLGSIHKLLLKF